MTLTCWLNCSVVLVSSLFLLLKPSVFNSEAFSHRPERLITRHQSMTVVIGEGSHFVSYLRRRTVYLSVIGLE